MSRSPQALYNKNTAINHGPYTNYHGGALDKELSETGYFNLFQYLIDKVELRV